MQKIVLDITVRAIRLTLALSLCAGPYLLQPLAGNASNSAAPADDLTKEAVDRGAARYTKAVNELGRIATMSLVTEKDFKNASATIDENIEGLRLVRYRMVQIALANRSFTRAVDDELNLGAATGRCIAPLCGGGSLAEQDAAFQKLGQNPRPLLEFSGARETIQSMQNEVKHDLQALERASEHLQKGAEKAQSLKVSFQIGENDRRIVKARFETHTEIPEPGTPDAAANAIEFLRSLFVATAITSNVFQTNGGGGPVKGLGRNSGGGGVGGGRSGPRADPSYLDGNPNYDNCVSKAKAARTSCKTLCYAGAFQWACLGSCDGAYLAQTALCVLGFN